MHRNIVRDVVRIKACGAYVREVILDEGETVAHYMAIHPFAPPYTLEICRAEIEIIDIKHIEKHIR